MEYENMSEGAYQMASSTKTKLSKMQERGQVTIPLEIREKLGLEPGDMVAFIETEEGILISPQEVVAMKALDKIGELLREKGISVDELIESGREVRGKLIEQKYGLTREQWEKSRNE